MISAADLQRLKLFSGVPAADVERLLRKYAVKHYVKGGLLFRVADDLRRLYVILRGTVKTYVYAPQGHKQIIHMFYPGDVFGGLVFGIDQDRPPWAEAAEDVLVIAISEPNFKELMQAFPDVCLNIFYKMVEHHETHVRRLQALIHTKASHRLVLTLLHLGDLQGDGRSSEFVLRGNLTQDDLANMTGLVRSTISELVGDLRGGGVVSGQRRQLRVDRKAAQRFLETV